MERATKQNKSIVLLRRPTTVSFADRQSSRLLCRTPARSSSNSIPSSKFELRASQRSHMHDDDDDDSCGALSAVAVVCSNGCATVEREQQVRRLCVERRERFFGKRQATLERFDCARAKLHCALDFCFGAVLFASVSWPASSSDGSSEAAAAAPLRRRRQRRELRTQANGSGRERESKPKVSHTCCFCESLNDNSNR